MFFSFFDWKIKLGVILTVVLMLGSVVSFIFAWNSPMPVDVYSALDQYISYRWFAFFLVSTLSVGGATVGCHIKQLDRF